jgi:uncharacterized protein (TIGR03083 family)
MGLAVELEAGRRACSESIQAFLDAADGFSQYELLGGSRCHGWTRLDVVVHVLAGWQEMLGGLVCVVESEPTVDAASYWAEFAVEYGGDDPVAGLMSQRRRTAAFVRPDSARAELRDVGSMLAQGVERYGDTRCSWQGHVFAAGDYLAIWAVENVVHHLDLLAGEPPPADALRLARATIEALIEAPLPATWADEEAVLIGTGRAPVPDGLGSEAARLPALG